MAIIRINNDEFNLYLYTAVRALQIIIYIIHTIDNRYICIRLYIIHLNLNYTTVQIQKLYPSLFY